MTTTTRVNDGPRHRWADILSPRRIGAIYVLLLLVVVFGALEPAQFLSLNTVLIIINGSAISGIVAVALVIPLAAGMFDVSIGYIIALSGTLVAYLVATAGLSGWPAILLTVLAGGAVALVNVFVVVVLHVQSLIGTLATGLVFLSITTSISNQQSITKNINKVSEALDFGTGSISLPFIGLIAVTAIIWFVMRSTTFGRYWYAIGYDAETSRLAGLPVARLQALALIVTGVCAAIAGVLVTARIGAGSPTTGPDYLLPAFAAAFVGATQFTPGRFNAPGAFLAVYVIATATVGLNIIGAPIWAGQLLQGVILIAAVAMNASQRRPRAVRPSGQPTSTIATPAGGSTESSAIDTELKESS